MSQTRISQARREAMLSSMSELGATRASSLAGFLPGHKILGTLAVAGASLAGAQSAEAEIIVANPDVNVGFAGGNIASYKLNIQSLKSGSLKLFRYFIAPGPTRVLEFQENAAVSFAAKRPSIEPAPAGLKFSQIGTSKVHGATSPFIRRGEPASGRPSPTSTMHSHSRTSRTRPTTAGSTDH